MSLTAVSVTLSAFGLVSHGQAEASVANSCSGRVATVRGTDGDDVLVGTSGADVIVGGAGNDTIYSLAGDDLVCADAGNDTVAGGDGSDQLFGDSGTDRLSGQAGRGDRCWDGESTSGCETVGATTTTVTTAPASTAPATSAPATTTAPSTTAPATTAPATTAPAITTPVPSVPVAGQFSDGFNDLSKWSALSMWSTQDQTSQSPDSTATTPNGRLRIVAADQNYGDALIRSNAKYALQSGTTVFKMDLDLGVGAQGSDSMLLGWPIARFTALPYGTATTFTGNGKGPTADNGVLIRFVNNCRYPWAPPSVVTWTNHTETLSDDTDNCDQAPTTQIGKLNRVEVRYTNATLSIWASDFSNDGTTFGALKHVADYPTTLPPSGYFTVGAHNHATLKYSNATLATIDSLFDNIAYPAAADTVHSYRNGQNVDPTTATDAYISFSAYNPSPAVNPTITINGHMHPITVTETLSHSFAEAIQIPVTDLITGNNVITFTGFAKTGNIDLVVTTTTTPAAAPPTPTTTAPTTSTPATTAPATTAPTTTAPAPATTAPGTTAPATTAPAAVPAPTTTAPPVGSGGFFEGFTTEAGKSRFDYQLHTSMNGGTATAIASSFMGEHNTDCAGPDTYRTISGGQSAPTFIDVSNSQLIWYCAPGNDPAKGHMMTALDTTDIAALSFSPKQTFNNVTKVCWDQNMNDLGEAKWVNMFVVPAADVTRNGGNLNYAAATGLPFGGFTQLLPAGAYDFTWLRGTTFVNGAEMMWASNAHGIAATSPPRFQICIQDSGRTLVVNRPDGTTDTINTGQTFPTGQVKVIMQDASYNPVKHNGYADHLTWHWDNITVDAG